jgi:exportin-1
VKHEWNTTWQNFISDICNSATENEAKCENALNILRLLSEEVFDFSKGTILQKDVISLKEKMSNEFEMVYNICMQVLQNS